MNKNSLLIHKLFTKTNIAIFCAIGMIVGFLISRAWCSFFTFAFGVAALWNIHPKNWKRDTWWLLSAFWVLMYGISYFWSMDVASWQSRIEVKLPVLLLPLAFTFLPVFSRKQLQFYTIVAGLIFVCSAVYSLSFFISNSSYYAEQYVYSHVLPTLVYGDHIRYSIALSLFIVWSVYAYRFLDKKWMKVLVTLIIVFLSVYLHTLAARSGLMVWYLFVIGYLVRYTIKRNIKVGIAASILLIIAVFFAVNYIPTLEKRVWYFKHTFALYKSGNLASGYSDIGRIISYNVGAKIIAANPLFGVGTGDMLHEMKTGYSRQYPDVGDEYRLLPHNQFMIVGLGCGIVVAVFFVAWAFYPIVWIRKYKNSFYLFIVWLSLVLSLCIEPMLEVQFGVLVFLFFLLFQRHSYLTDLQGEA